MSVVCKVPFVWLAGKWPGTGGGGRFVCWWHSNLVLEVVFGSRWSLKVSLLYSILSARLLYCTMYGGGG